MPLKIGLQMRPVTARRHKFELNLIILVAAFTASRVVSFLGCWPHQPSHRATSNSRNAHVQCPDQQKWISISMKHNRRYTTHPAYTRAEYSLAAALTMLCPTMPPSSPKGACQRQPHRNPGAPSVAWLRSSTLSICRVNSMIPVGCGEALPLQGSRNLHINQHYLASLPILSVCLVNS